MGNFALLLCQDGSEHAVEHEDGLNSLFSRWGKMFKRHRFDGAFSCTRLDADLSICLIVLPYSLYDLQQLRKSKINRINSYISETASKNSIDKVILPDKLSKLHLFQSCTVNPFKGRYLYRSLLINMLGSICSGNGIKIGDLDISIVSRRCSEQLHSTIKFIMPMAKYITIITEDRDAMEEDINRIYEDTGLSIGITGDYKTGLRGSNVIINLDSLNDLAPRARANKKALIINLAEPAGPGTVIENTIIDGIEVGLPASLESGLNELVYSYFSRLELAEIVLSHRIACQDEAAAGILDYEHMLAMANAFVRSRYRITGYTGRYTTLSTDSVKLRA